MHEFGHYGDKATNNGSNTGQSTKKDGDLKLSTDKTPPIQWGVAHSGDRGSDIDNKILTGLTSQLGNLFSVGDNGVLSGGAKKMITNSTKYKKWVESRK